MGEPALTVTQAMALAKRALETVRVLVAGEVTELSDKPGYKAVYFTLADGCSNMPCLMWRDAYQATGVQLREGMMVELGGSFSAYAPKGRLQFQVRSMSAAGEGALRLQVAALARRLEAEGLMRPERKRALPAYPERIAVVTSPRGKAVHDVIRTLKRRYPMAELLVAGVAVEGAEAASRIAAGVRRAGQSGADLLILCRGGGSYEDLMPFNAEEVARAVADCPVPVVTGIGHEPDDTIADMVSDVRASTPTAAAEAAAPDTSHVARHLTHSGARFARSFSSLVGSSKRAVSALGSRPVLRDPRWWLSVRSQSLDLAADGLARALPAVLERHVARVATTEAGLARGAARALERSTESLARYAARLGDLSPLAILARGYAVCYDESGRRVVRAAGEVSEGDALKVRLGHGMLGCRVETVESEG